MPETALQKVSVNSTIHKIWQFYSGVRGISLLFISMLLLTVVEQAVVDVAVLTNNMLVLKNAVGKLGNSLICPAGSTGFVLSDNLSSCISEKACLHQVK